MSRILLAILLVVPAIFAKIEIDVTASRNNEDSLVSYHGKDVHVITDQEQATFNLNSEELRNAVQSFFGAKPTEAYLKSPTPWGDLYKTYKWRQVSRILTAQKADILSVDSEPTVISGKVLENTNSEQTTLKVSIQDYIDFNVSSAWNNEQELITNEDIKYDFDLLRKDGKSHLFSYTGKWGEDVRKSHPVMIESEFEISLNPQQVVIAELHVVKSTMKIHMDYETSLAGSVAVYYPDSFKGHQFWSLDVKSVMEAGGVKPVHSSEIIEFQYYSGAKVVIRDTKTDEILYTVHRIPMKF